MPASDLKTSGKNLYMVTISATVNGIRLKSISSNSANLTISTFPTITINKQPTDKTVDTWESKLPTFSVGINPIQDAQLNYQWFWGTPDPKDPWHLIAGANSPSYTVNASEVSQTQLTKHYYVRISGSVNGMPLRSINSNVATLRVNFSPKITIISNPKNIKLYTNIGNKPPIYSVVAKTNIPNATLKYQWYKKWWNGWDQNASEKEIVGATDASYTIPASELWYPNGVVSRVDLFYVKITAFLNGVEIASTISNPATLSFAVYNKTN